ncbi:hypothetical protein HJFPF1_09262 [Paramyrothecium foliicola]|nr:hypothetical protein HJFPF1_09262 [Paramyrothecium foliicola]
MVHIKPEAFDRNSTCSIAISCLRNLTYEALTSHRLRYRSIKMRRLEDWSLDVDVDGMWPQSRAPAPSPASATTAQPQERPFHTRKRAQINTISDCDTTLDADYMVLGLGRGAGYEAYPYPHYLEDLDGSPNEEAAQASKPNATSTSRSRLAASASLPSSLHTADVSAFGWEDFSRPPRNAESHGPTLSLDHSYLFNVADLDPPCESMSPNGFTLFPGSNSVSSSALSPSLGFGGLHIDTNTEDGDYTSVGPRHSFLDVQHNQRLPTLMTECLPISQNSRTPLPDEAIADTISPFSTSPTFSWPFPDHTGAENTAIDEVSSNHWDFTNLDSTSNLDWPETSGNEFYELNHHTVAGLPRVQSHVNTAVQDYSWDTQPGYATAPLGGIDEIAFVPSHTSRSHYSNSNLAAPASIPSSLTDTRLLTVPKTSSHRRMSDPPPLKKSLGRTSLPNQRARAKSTLAAGTANGYPLLQPQPAQPWQKTKEPKSPGATVCQKVDESDCCHNCRKVTANSSKHPYVCTKAYFMELVNHDTTNYVASYAINHPLRGSLGRRRLDVPKLIEIPKLLQMVEGLSKKYTIRVLQGKTVLYDLDLHGCSSYLRAIRPTLPEAYSFQTFIATQLSRNGEWRSCIHDNVNKLSDIFGALTLWNTMPSRVTYALVPYSTGKEHQLDPDSIDDQQVLLAAAQLSRIVSRKLELAAYTQLQTELTTKTSFGADFLLQLAQLLLSLRWRLSWWAVLGSGVVEGAHDEAIQQRQTFDSVASRVRSLCRILYFYYCCMSRRVPRFNEETPRGRRFRYPDTQNAVEERYPEDESLDGFEHWIKEGHDKIREARAPEQLKIIGLSQ